jgi:hypothetical protein
MPTKDDTSDKENCLNLFLKIGLDERTARNTIANNKVTTNLTAVIHEVFIFFLSMLSFSFSIQLILFYAFHRLVLPMVAVEVLET